LTVREPGNPASADVRPLSARDYVLGRAIDCDIALPGTDSSISRRHARLIHRQGEFFLSDVESRNGTAVNEDLVAKGEERLLRDGDRIRIGHHIQLVFADLSRRAVPSAGVRLHDRFLALVREVSTLELPRVVERGLDLLRLASGVERSYLVGAGNSPRLDPHLLSLLDPSLRVSRSTIEEALRSGRKVTQFLEGDLGDTPSHSVAELGLHRIWVSPIRDAGGRAVAAVYLDSQAEGTAFDAETERLMDAVVDQIALALRNASLHAEVVALNESLEQKVLERTRQLEESHARLVSQDRLATLGRLVAAIAHELNNPAGALVSMAGTLEGLLMPMLRIWDAATEIYPDPRMAERAWDFLLLSLVPSPLRGRCCEGGTGSALGCGVPNASRQNWMILGHGASVSQ